MKEIGGFFGLEYIKNQEYHSKAIKLNSARYSIEYILRSRKYKKIYIPYYSDDSLLQPALNTNIQFEFYNINKEFEPIITKEILPDEVVLIINYFGLISDKLELMAKKYKNVIIDNTQAFFVKPLENIDTVYSPRKFLGVSDGGYLYSTCNYIKLKKDVSFDRYKYILKRTDLSASSAYEDFIANEKVLDSLSILEMSNLTKALLSSFDYELIKKKRETNFYILHEIFNKVNEIKIPNTLLENGPMIYPLLLKNNIKEFLIEKKIYIPTYWKDARKRVSANTFEAYLSENLLPLPIDQRYSKEEMLYMANLINKRL